MPSSQGCQRDSESHVQNSSEERSVQLVVSPSPGLGARGGGPLCLLPAATMSVRGGLLPPELSRSSALLSPSAQSGEAWKAAGAQADGKQRENKGTASKRPKGRGPPSPTGPGQPVLTSACATPGFRPPGPPLQTSPSLTGGSPLAG